jgi:hypothetical protein
VAVAAALYYAVLSIAPIVNPIRWQLIEIRAMLRLDV